MSASLVRPRRDPAKQARGRRIVLWLVGLFVAAQGIAGYGIDRHGLAFRFQIASNVLLEAEAGPPPNVVWMGSSRSEGGVRPDVMNLGLWRRFGRHRVNLFNAAVPAGDPVVSEFLLDALLERGHRPEILVVEVSPDMLARPSGWVGMHVIRQTNWAEVPAILPEAARTQNAARLVMARMLPLYMHRRNLRAVVLPPPVSSEPSPLVSSRCWAMGHSHWAHRDDYPDPPPSPVLSSRRIDFDVGRLAQTFVGYRTDGVVSAALERLLARCDAEGISVVLVLPAVSQNFRDIYTPEVEVRFQDHLARLRETHPFEVVDLRDTVPDAGFVDLHHLDFDSGALLYSRAALKRVVLPAVERRRAASR